MRHFFYVAVSSIKFPNLINGRNKNTCLRADVVILHCVMENNISEFSIELPTKQNKLVHFWKKLITTLFVYH